MSQGKSKKGNGRRVLQDRIKVKTCRFCGESHTVDQTKRICPLCGSMGLELSDGRVDLRPQFTPQDPQTCEWPGCVETDRLIKCTSSHGCQRHFCQAHYLGRRYKLKDLPPVCWLCEEPIRRLPVFFKDLLVSLLKPKKTPPKQG